MNAPLPPDALRREPLTPGLGPPSPLRAAIEAAHRVPEPQALPPLLSEARLPAGIADRARALARRLATSLRHRGVGTGRAGLVQGLLQEFALSSREGVALMCLAEALLRIPDAATRDALIRDKIADGEWESHLGRSGSMFVNAAAWGLLLTGKLVATHSESGMSSLLRSLLARGGAPMVRRAVDMAMRMMGEQFVTGETIGAALRHARPLEARGFRYSYDMLGESALTLADAERYRRSYEEAIDAIGRASGGRGVLDGPGISIKLSALHPRYARAQQARVMDELYPVLRDLAVRAHGHDIGLNIDAEETDRLDLSLDLLERLCFEPALAGWNGIGFVVQAYQKRCPSVIDVLVDLARRSRHRLMVRLVKGAYWDSEIKRAQVDGLDGYPVYTRKAHTDVAYIACARRLLAAPDAVFPQFATHNAQTLATIHALADPACWTPGQYEFQCLHGMGEPLYEQVVGPLERPCRIYAPVGPHETLLAYLVRRLLENGANSSFVNRIADPAIAIDALVLDPVKAVEDLARIDGVIGSPHPAIPLPKALHGPARPNARGLDLASESVLRSLDASLGRAAGQVWQAGPPTADAAPSDAVAPLPVRNPADRRDIVGWVRETTTGEIEQALQTATRATPRWAAAPPLQRADMLCAAADRLEADMTGLMSLLTREAGKTCAAAVAEVREAADFLRFYAGQARSEFDNATHPPLGPVVCISPWNFPLAIFTGQVAAALAAGNVVLAKPAEQTPLVAAAAVRALWAAGVPAEALQLLPGSGEVVGARLVDDPRVQGVMFTGSTAVARLLQQSLSRRLDDRGRPVTLIAETGGINAMVVDSSALAEQVVTDALASAFDSAGQRCSALRVLCLQDDGADRLLAMLLGAMRELQLGDPARLATDIGPVIDEQARDGIERHVEAMRAAGHAVHRFAHAEDAADGHGCFVAPTVIELDNLAELRHEIFGPVLHVVRFRRAELDGLLQQINDTGYGLTLGVHTRIDETIARVAGRAAVGNLYVNRNMVGAVVGVQPFGGEGLSGTGPKAGGPLYLPRLSAARAGDALARAMDDHSARSTRDGRLASLLRWAEAAGDAPLIRLCERFGQAAAVPSSRTLAGPTGESNTYALAPRRAVLCLANNDADRLVQLAAVLAVGSRAVWPEQARALHARLPADVRAAITLGTDGVVFDAAIHHGSPEALIASNRALAQRGGPIVALQGLAAGDTDLALERLVVERVTSVNTAAAGGNASLMVIA